MNKISFFFLKKFLQSGKREIFRFDNLFLIIGIIISVAVLTISLALFEGYQQKLKDTILSINSHIYIFRNDVENLDPTDFAYVKSSLKDFAEIEVISPIIDANLMAVNDNRIKGCVVKGIDTQAEKLSFGYHEYVKQGTSNITDANSVVVGDIIAQKLNATIGDTIDLISPLQTEISVMGIKQKRRSVKVVGIFSSGMHDYDKNFIFSDIELANEFNPTKDQFTLFGIKVHDQYIDGTQEIAYKIFNVLGSYYQVRSWQEFNLQMFEMINFQKWLLFIIMSFLIVIAAFNVISTITTMIISKKTEIGIMKTYGLSDVNLYRIFLLRTLLIGSVAIFSGVILGVIFSEIISMQNLYQLKGEIYFLNRIFVSFDWFNILVTIFTAHFIIFVTALIPLKRIKKLEIIKIIRERE